MSMLIFNPDGSDRKEDRKIWKGNPTNAFNFNEIKYDWAFGLYRQMRQQFWIPEKYDLTADVTDYKNLTPDEFRAFNGILSYLNYLDSIQVINLPNIKNQVTAPELQLCFSEQISQESMHAQSYQYMIETIVPISDRNAVYEFWKTDKLLLERCKFIANCYQEYSDKQTDENYFYVLITDYLLEGLFFFNGFNYYYNLASRQLMSGSADIFKTINRDELSHLRLFQKIIPEAMAIFPYSEEKIYQLVDTSVNHEINWTNHITNGQILGITDASTEQYTKYLANTRLRAIGLIELYSDDIYISNPYKHLEKFADTGKEGSTKANFFEAGVTAYSMSESIEGWDDL